MSVNRKRTLLLAKELVTVSSENPPGREAEVARLLRNHLEAHGIASIMVGPKDRPNLLFYSHEGEKGPLVIHGHMDTVPVGPRENWSHDPFGGEIVDGRLYGRGACDMKGPLAALAETLIVYTEEKHEVPLLMLATSDEESGCSGAEEVARSGILSGVKYGICAEPTNLRVLVGEKGMLWVRVVARGKSAHGSRPHEGVNAIELCMRALDVLTHAEYSFEETEFMGRPTINVGRIEGGVKINVVPDQCKAEIDMRLVKGQGIESTIEAMKEHLQAAGLSPNVAVEYIHGKPAVITPPDSEIVTIVRDAVEAVTGFKSPLVAAPYGTDCSVLQPKIGITNVICGPGSIEQAHQPDEFIRVNQLFQAVDVYLAAARAIARVQR
ncbi:MAG: M20 family metallopeptidase [Candidatus Thorarchaeota archaeon]